MNVEMANPRTSEYEPDPDLRDREHVPRLEPGLGRVGEAGMIDQSKPPDSSAITPVANFDSLVRAITLAHESLLMKAVKAVNVSLTLRNWLIGFYIAVYEQQGADRATYGEHLLEKLAKRLEERGVKNSSERELRRYRRFYQIYPQIRETVSPEFRLHLAAEKNAEIRGMALPELRIDAKTMIERLSYSHLAAMMEIDDLAKRAFYEIECLKGAWSVRELRRQIASLLYERTGLSHDKRVVIEIAQASTKPESLDKIIRDPYVFEFLGLTARDVMSENALEEALINKLQEFLLELGRGFCFEARQRRILMGGEHFFVDLVFYHRILKCHVLIELKVGGFSHEHLGQLNTYLSWYRVNEMTEGDNPPVGVLLCTEKNRVLVEYALAGLDNRLFVSKYQLSLPDKEEMRRFIEVQMEEELGAAASSPEEGGIGRRN
jgi:predicted nuclease of restriction endonuclease-like (RecB) superfamily